MSPPALVLKVARPLPLPWLFDYAPPPGVDATGVVPGQRVRVPLGTRELTGLVDSVGAADPHAAELRQAHALCDDVPLLDGELLASLRWLARYTHAPAGEVYATALPAALRRGEPLPDTRTWAWRLTEAGATSLTGLRKDTRPRRLAELLQAGGLDEDALDAAIDGWRSGARALAKRELVERVAAAGSARVVCDPTAPGFAPNPEQGAAIDSIGMASGFTPFLLDGVTGSGKTEVYLQAIAGCLARGRQALVLVPEIGLTPQLLARFRARLGVAVHASHSGLSDGERARVWTAAWRGEARVVVGTRSAVFAPLPAAGLIVVDEEHDTRTEQQDGLTAHAREH